jgi:hypothetical protein
VKRANSRALVAAREEGLRRVQILTRTTLVGGLIGVGVLSAAVAHALPGHTGATKPHTPRVKHHKATPPSDPNSIDNAPQPAEQAPVQTYQAPVTTSGGS